MGGEGGGGQVQDGLDLPSLLVEPGTLHSLRTLYVAPLPGKVLRLTRKAEHGKGTVPQTAVLPGPPLSPGQSAF